MNARVMKKRSQSLQDNIKAIEIHLQGIEVIIQRLQPFFPFTAEKIEELTADEKVYCDGLIYRFTHVQDTLAGRIFPAFLDAIKEEPGGPSVIDKLNLLEKLGYIESTYQWVDLRDLRNDLSHEYVTVAELQADLLNQVRDSISVLVSTFDRIKKRLVQ